MKGEDKVSKGMDHRHLVRVHIMGGTFSILIQSFYWAIQDWL